MKIGRTDDFEGRYVAKFRALAAPHGIFVEYAVDRAGRDIGLHFTDDGKTGGKIVLPSLAWFQMKGIMPSTLPISSYQKADAVKLRLKVGHLAFWHLNPQPTYLVVYIGCADEFLAIDIQKWVRDKYGDGILTLAQDDVVVAVSKTNRLDDHLFRLIKEKNLIPALRSKFSAENDREIARFLRDSSVVKWMLRCDELKIECRLRVVKYMSKMRTEAYFEERADGESQLFRTHWEFAMGPLPSAYPFLTLKPKIRVVEVVYMEKDEFEGEEYERQESKLSFEPDDDADDLYYDEDEIDGDALLELGNGVYSYSEGGGGEIMTHELRISLNEVGQRWAKTLAVLERAEVVQIDARPHSIDVAPWHARDV